jgi:endonuclease YncB( thermonuclease family)
LGGGRLTIDCQWVACSWQASAETQPQPGAALAALLDGQPLTCTEVDGDRYGRTVATCTVAGQDIGAAMVRQGWALDVERYSSGRYAAEQLDAEQAQRGLWSGSFVPPWE